MFFSGGEKLYAFIYQWLNEEEFDLANCFSDTRTGISSKVTKGTISANFVQWCYDRDATVIYHPADDQDPKEEGKPWNGYNHFHVIWASKAQPTQDRKFVALKQLYQEMANSRADLPTIAIKFPAAMAKYLSQPPRSVERWGGGELMHKFNILVDPYILPKAGNFKRKESAPPAPESTAPPATPVPTGDPPVVTPTSPTYIHNTTKGMEQLEYLMWNIKRTGALSIGELISAMAKVHNQSKWLCLYTAPHFTVLAKKAFELVKAVSASKCWQELLDDYEGSPKGDKRFYDLDTSLDIFNNWIHHHSLDKEKFLTELYDVLTQRRSKINSFVLQGPSNAGKSYILRTLRYISVAYGEIHAGDNNAFQFQNCINTNLIYIDEPRISPEIAEQMKLVLEGCPTKVKVKCKDDEILNRTPVIMTSNSNVWRWCAGEERAFKNRMFLYRLTQPCDWLKKCQKALNPFMWVALFNEKLLNYADDGDLKDTLELLNAKRLKTTPSNPPPKTTPAAPKPKNALKRRLEVQFEEESSTSKKPCEGCDKDLPSQRRVFSRVDRDWG